MMFATLLFSIINKSIPSIQRKESERLGVNFPNATTMQRPRQLSSAWKVKKEENNMQGRISQAIITYSELRFGQYTDLLMTINILLDFNGNKVIWGKAYFSQTKKVQVYSEPKSL